MKFLTVFHCTFRTDEKKSNFGPFVFSHIASLGKYFSLTQKHWTCAQKIAKVFICIMFAPSRKPKIMFLKVPSVIYATALLIIKTSFQPCHWHAQKTISFNITSILSMEMHLINQNYFSTPLVQHISKKNSTWKMISTVQLKKNSFFMRLLL